MATPTADSYSAGSGSTTIFGGRVGLQPLPPQMLVSNGVWTWFSDSRAITHTVSGQQVTDIGYVTNNGSPGVTRVPHFNEGARTSFLLRNAMELDDHNNAVLLKRQDGRLLTAYCKHPEPTTIHRVRVSASEGSIASWGTEATPTATNPTYANLFYLSVPQLTCLIYRSGLTATMPGAMITSANGGDTWGAEEFLYQFAGQRPYPQYTSNGTNRIDVFTTQAHPSGLNTSVYHFYILFAADGSKTFHASNGASLGPAPVSVDAATLVYDGSSQRAWTWDITYGTDGHPRVMFQKRQSATDFRLMMSRWTGSAWTTPTQIAAMGSYIYVGQEDYTVGGCFDGNTPDRAYVSVESGGTSELQEYRTANNGATWTKHRDITTGSGTWNFRPWSPRGHDGRVAVLWCRGVYTSYLDYNMEIWGAG